MNREAAQPVPYSGRLMHFTKQNNKGFSTDTKTIRSKKPKLEYNFTLFVTTKHILNW